MAMKQQGPKHYRTMQEKQLIWICLEKNELTVVGNA